MENIDKIFDQKDIKKTKEKLKNGTAPCNISGLINELLDENIILKERLTKIEKELGL